MSQTVVFTNRIVIYTNRTRKNENILCPVRKNYGPVHKNYSPVCKNHEMGHFAYKNTYNEAIFDLFTMIPEKTFYWL